MASIAFKREGDTIIIIGETKGHLGQSLYLREIEGREEGAPPPVDLGIEKRNGDFVRGLIEGGRADTVHDISDGGFFVAIAEMVMAGGIGAQIFVPAGCNSIPFLFGEDQGRYVLASQKGLEIVGQAKTLGIPALLLGTTRGRSLAVKEHGVASIGELRAAHESWFPQYMNADAA